MYRGRGNGARGRGGRMGWRRERRRVGPAGQAAAALAGGVQDAFAQAQGALDAAAQIRADAAEQMANVGNAVVPQNPPAYYRRDFRRLNLVGVFFDTLSVFNSRIGGPIPSAKWLSRPPGVVSIEVDQDRFIAADLDARCVTLRESSRVPAGVLVYRATITQVNVVSLVVGVIADYSQDVANVANAFGPTITVKRFSPLLVDYLLATFETTASMALSGWLRLSRMTMANVPADLAAELYEGSLDLALIYSQEREIRRSVNVVPRP